MGERLECLMVQQRFGDNLVEIEKKLNNFKHVCDLLLKGQGIRSVVKSPGPHPINKILAKNFTLRWN